MISILWARYLCPRTDRNWHWSAKYDNDKKCIRCGKTPEDYAGQYKDK